MKLINKVKRACENSPAASNKELAKKLKISLSYLRKLKTSLLKTHPHLSKRVAWTEAENQILRDNPTLGPTKLAALLPNRSHQAITSQRNTLLKKEGSVKKLVLRWNQADIAFVKENLGKMPVQEIAKAIGRGNQAIYAKFRVGNRIPSSKKQQLIRCLEKNLPPSQIAALTSIKLTTTRNLCHTYRKAYRIPTFCKNWEAQEIEDLKTLWNQGASPKEISQKLQRSTKSIQTKRRNLGLPNRISFWNEKDTKNLLDLQSQSLSHKDIAEALKLPLKRVKSKIQNLREENGLTKTVNHWSPQEIQRVGELVIKNTPLKQCQEELDRPEAAIRQIARDHHFVPLSWQKGPKKMVVEPWKRGVSQKIQTIQ